MVTEERARQLSQPRLDAQGKPVALDPGRRGPAPRSESVSAAPLPPASPAQAAPPPIEQTGEEEDRSKRKVRAVGPTFYPAR